MKFRFLIGFAMVAAASALTLVNPLVSGQIIDRVIKGGEASLIWVLLGMMLGATILRMGIRYGFQMIFEFASQRVIKSIRTDLFDQIQFLDFSYFDKTKTGDIMAHMSSDIDAVRHGLAWVLYQIFENGLVFVVSIITLSTINLPFTLCLLATAPFIGLAAFQFAQKVKPTFGRIRDQFSRLNSVVQENIAANKVVRALAREDHEIDKFNAENIAYKERNLESAYVAARYIPRIEFFSGALMAVMILAGGLLVIGGTLSLGQLVVFSGLIWAINNPLRMSGWLINDLRRISIAVDRLFKLSQQTPVLKQKPDALRPDHIKGEIEFRDVSLDYGNGTVLKKLNFKVKPGMTVGILGPTGSGKSSVARLICRHYDASEGQVLIDGTDVRDLDLVYVRRHVGITMQDVFLYSDTIEGNVAFSDPEMPMDRVISAAHEAFVDEFVDKLPEKYDTIVGERGVGLSGGQRQRVALARLFAAAPPVMILDDTTSAVDVETEEFLQGQMRALHGSKTVFIIAHRITSIMHADLILVLRDGEIAERGTHESLVGGRGYYAEVWEHQNLAAAQGAGNGAQ